MTKYIISLIFTLISVLPLFATNAEERTDTAVDPVLNELQIIRSIQEESQEHRRKAVVNRQKKDSILKRQQDIELLSDYALMSMIEENTHQDKVKDGWNLYGWIAFIVAVVSLAVSSYACYAQNKTEQNTKKLSRDMQKSLLIALIRHLYRNLVIIHAMRSKLEDIEYDGYVSEEHFEKLKIPMNNIHLDSFYGEDKYFRIMHNLYLNLRNYNEEIEVAKKHIVNPLLSRSTKEEDIDTLEFKVYYLTERIFETIYRIWGQVDDSIKDVKRRKEEMDNNPVNQRLKGEIKSEIQIALEGLTNVSNNIDVEGSDKFRHLTVNDIKNTSYSRLFNNEELASICEILNKDIKEERKKNSRGAWKLRMIRF